MTGVSVRIEREQHPAVDPLLPYALLATAAVILIPLLAILGLLAATEPDPPLLLAVALGIALSIVVAAAGNMIWRHRKEAQFISFGELMLWSYLRRRHAENKVADNARLLGLDRMGQPESTISIPREEQLGVLTDLTGALEIKDSYTLGHSNRVERHAYRTALSLNMSKKEIEELRMAASLHDVGKIRVPDRILRKPSGLTIEERLVVEEHAVVGAWMVSSIGSADVIAGVRHHHERWDGNGYPDGLAGHRIPLYSRVIAVADAYDAMTSSRPYRASLGRSAAVDCLRTQSGTQFDPAVVEAFISTLPVPVPVAGLLLLLAGPQRVLREIAAWFRRVGAGNLAPAVGAAGMSLVLGASVFAPAVVKAPPSQRPAAAISAPSIDAPDDGDDVLGDRVKREPKKKAERAPKKDADETGGTATGPSTDTEPDTTTTEPEPEPEPDPDPPPPDDGGKKPKKTKPKGDPQPERGRDCGSDKKASKGTSKHCG
jgi:HD-GYP domain-containing protein (c-di-GMP phosphodiesterase class II)